MFLLFLRRKIQALQLLGLRQWFHRRIHKDFFAQFPVCWMYFQDYFLQDLAGLKMKNILSKNLKLLFSTIISQLSSWSFCSKKSVSALIRNQSTNSWMLSAHDEYNTLEFMEFIFLVSIKYWHQTLDKRLERVQIMRQKLKQVTIWFLVLIAASSSRALDV